jgi:hypothetical protein
MIRRNPKAKGGWDNGDIDAAFQLFSCGMVWDGNLTSKSSRDHLVRNGYAVSHDGMQSLTGRGVLAFLSTPVVWRSAWRMWRRWGRNPLVADANRIKRAMR